MSLLNATQVQVHDSLELKLQTIPILIMTVMYYEKLYLVMIIL
jgi:hypothetical protein